MNMQKSGGLKVVSISQVRFCEASAFSLKEETGLSETFPAF